jgi:hypothetical protein
LVLRLELSPASRSRSERGGLFGVSGSFFSWANAGKISAAHNARAEILRNMKLFYRAGTAWENAV